MSIRFILAPAGGGKTWHCLQEIAALEKADPLGTPVYFILPEQATFIHERLLCQTCAGGGFCRTRVLSFNRLVYHAYKYRHQQPMPQLSEAGKLLLAGRVINETRSQLQVYAAASSGAGFASYLVKAAEELATYGISPEQLEQAVLRLAEREGETRQVERLRETALLYRCYQQTQSHDYASYASNMDYLAESIRLGMISNADIYIDGYLEFTPAELVVLAALLSDDSNRINITLPIDPALLEKNLLAEHVFAAPLATWQRLTTLAESQHATIMPPLLLSGEKGRFAANQELAALEAALAGRKTQQLTHQPQTIRLCQALDRRAELESIGREMIRLVREEGLRFRDISLITRDTAPYEELLAEVFGAMDIPYFIDAKKPLLFHPLFELVRAALECWAYHPKYEHILRFVKNPLLPISRKQADLLDNYALAHGLRFWHFQSEAAWDFSPLPDESEDAAAAADAVRQQACGPLLQLIRDLPLQTSARELNEHLLTMLKALDIEAAVSRLAEQARLAGDGEEALFHEQAWDKLNEFLTESSGLLGEESMPAAQLLRLYDVAFAGLTISTIPPGLDQVLVSSLERSRSPELKAAFVPTVNDGLLPRRIIMEGLFTDADRQALRACGAALAPDTIARQFQEDYLCYIALTRSSGKLYLSYISRDEQGRDLKPSPLLRRVAELFPSLSVQQAEPFPASQLIGGEIDLAQMAIQLSRAAEGQEIADFWPEVYAYYQADEHYTKLLSQLEKGLYYQPLSHPLSRPLRERIYGNTLHSSVSRLEKFRLCPFAYFAGYGLKLKKRSTYELDPASRGQLYHEVLADIGQSVRDAGLSWPDIDEEEAAQLVDASLEKYLPQLLAGILRSSARYQYLSGRIRGAILSAVLLLIEHTKRGDFIPVAWELPFGSKDPDSLPAFKISLPDGRTLELSGRIDRVDMAYDPDSGKSYFRIIDYKSGQLSLRPEDIMAGLRLQLLVYLEVVLMNADVFTSGQPEAAGIYYSQVGDGLENSERDDMADPVGLRLSGLTVRDEEAIRLADREISGNSALVPIGMGKKGIYAKPAGLTPQQLTELEQQLIEVLQQTASEIMEGLISVSPLRDDDFDACAYCDYASVCGFDRSLVPMRKKNFPHADKDTSTGGGGQVE